MKPTALLLLALAPLLHGDPLLSSWHTEDAGKLARIWPTIAAETTERGGGGTTSLTTWNRADFPANEAGFAAGDQTVPVYAGIQAIYYSATHVYVRSSGLPTNTMGPWYDDIYTRTTLFASFPGNAKILYRFPRSTSYTSTYVSTKQATAPGSCGLYVNGVPLFNTTDTFSYSNSAGKDAGPGTGVTGMGDNVWHRDAFTNEGPTFDAGFSHQAMEQHHYHATAPALRHQLGDSMDYDPTAVYTGLVSQGGTNPYTENPNGKHSPILGWVNDGLPMYGPYGYSDPTDPNSPVRRMVTGYQDRDGTFGSTNLASTGRNTLPQWSITLAGNSSTTVASNQWGPDISATFPLGKYMEDYAFKGDLTGLRLYEGVATHAAFNATTDYDLDEYNVRWCVTPEFPAGTWAYFNAVEANGDPTYPYNLSWSYFGTPAVSGSVNSIGETVSTYFEGEASKEEANRSITTDQSTDDITIVWDGLEGGIYRVETSIDAEAWDSSAAEFTSTSDQITVIDDTSLAGNISPQFYRLNRTGITTYESVGITTNGGGTDNTSFTFNFSGNLPPEATPITGATVGGVTGTVTAYSASGTNATATISFDNTSFAIGAPKTAILNVNGPPPQMQPLTFTSTNTYTRTN